MYKIKDVHFLIDITEWLIVCRLTLFYECICSYEAFLFSQLFLFISNTLNFVLIRPTPPTWRRSWLDRPIRAAVTSNKTQQIANLKTELNAVGLTRFLKLLYYKK